MSQSNLTNKQNRGMGYTYNPENQTREELINNFVIRTKEYQRIYSDISETNLKDNPQHYLLEGQRGTGKTSLMLRLRYEIETQQNNNSKEVKHLIPIQFREEQYGIINLCRLWEKVADHLYEVEGFETLSDELQTHSRQKDYATICFSIVDKYLIKHKKRVVLFLDNFGDMLDKFSDIELKRLRDIFHTSKHIQLIGASARTLEYTYKHDQPFYEFFNIVRLKSLSKKQAIALLMQLAARHNSVNEIERIKTEEPERIETIRILTGGVPRTIVLLFEILLDQNGDVFEDLEDLLDRVTPLYKHRMDDLKPKQQAIIDVIALNWDGITNAEIVERLNNDDFDSKKVAAQLKALEKNDLVESKKIDKKNNIYFIRERFFNIWYLMRLSGRKDKCRVKWLVEFLRAWYSQDSLTERIEKHIEQANKGRLNEKSAYYLTEAMAQITSDIGLQDDLIASAKDFLQKEQSQFKDELSASFMELMLKTMVYLSEGNYLKVSNGLLTLTKNYNEINHSIMIATLNIVISETYLKHSNYIESDKLIRQYLVTDIEMLNNELFSEMIVKILGDFLINYISTMQYHSVYLLFSDFPILKEKLKPTYYALISLIKDEYPKEYIKMGKELEPTVNEILKDINARKEIINVN